MSRLAFGHFERLSKALLLLVVKETVIKHAEEIKQLRMPYNSVTSFELSICHLYRHDQHPDKEYGPYYPEAKYRIPATTFSIR